MLGIENGEVYSFWPLRSPASFLNLSFVELLEYSLLQRVTFGACCCVFGDGFFLPTRKTLI